MGSEPISNALTHPEIVTNWWPIALLFVMWLFREVIGFLVKQKHEKSHPQDLPHILKSQLALLEEQKESLIKVSHILDFFSDTVLSMAKDIAILKDRGENNDE